MLLTKKEKLNEIKNKICLKIIYEDQSSSAIDGRVVYIYVLKCSFLFIQKHALWPRGGLLSLTEGRCKSNGNIMGWLRMFENFSEIRLT